MDGVKRWLARKLWAWSLRLGMDQEGEVQEAIRLILRQKMEELGPSFMEWVSGEPPVHRVRRYGEARNVGVIRKPRV